MLHKIKIVLIILFCIFLVIFAIVGGHVFNNVDFNNFQYTEYTQEFE